MDKKELIKLIKENFTEENDSCITKIDLSGLDFGDAVINLNGLKAKVISNQFQEAKEYLNNDNQKSPWIHNEHQIASMLIYNDDQKAKRIYNTDQEAEEIYNLGQKAEESIRNEGQRADKVYN